MLPLVLPLEKIEGLALLVSVADLLVVDDVVNVGSVPLLLGPTLSLEGVSPLYDLGPSTLPAVLVVVELVVLDP